MLWIDELEKGFSGSRSSGATDGGTSSRGVRLASSPGCRRRRSPVFIVATANDVSQLPPEMLRKGRWDELFFVDLPNREEREVIWQIQVAKHGRDTRQFDLAQLAKATDGLTGAEIEQVFIEAMYRAFDRGRGAHRPHHRRGAGGFRPALQADGGADHRAAHWAKGRARPATTQFSERKLRKIAA